jgi:multidrug efflux system outer membrane protein
MMRRTFSFAAAALLSACMVGPDYQRPAVDLPAGYAGTASAAAPLPVPQAWWTLYHDAALEGLVKDGLAHNAQVQLAAARVEEAAAAMREAGADLTPLVEGSAGATRGRFANAGYTTTDVYTLGASASFELDLWGRLRRARLAVRDSLLASRDAQDTVAITLAGAITRAYFATVSLDSQAAASADTLRAAQESLAVARKRADAGVSSELDVHQAEGLRAQAAAQAKDIARQRAVVQHELAVLTGRLDLEVAAGTLQNLPDPPLPPAGLPSELLTRRPDVRQSEAELAAATQFIGVARAAQFPTLTLTASAGSQSSELGQLLTGGSEIWSVGGGLLGPILDAGRYRARTGQAVARAHQAEALYRQAVQNAFRDVADALSNVQQAKASEADLQDRVGHAQQALHLAMRRYDSGYSAYLEVLDAQRTVNDAQLAFLRNRQAYLSYTVDLMTALGGGWDPARGS